MIKLGKVYISFFVIVFVFICIVFDVAEFMALSYLSLVIHECFHLSIALKIKIKISRIVILPFGINIKINEKILPAYEILLCAMGPFGSFVTALIFFCLKWIGIYYKYLDYMIISNLSLFIVNILPIYPLDGGRILKCILENKIGYYRAAHISLWVSQMCVLIMCVFIFAGVVLSKFNLSVVVLCCFLIYSMSQQKNEAIMSFSRLLMYSKEKLERRKQLPVKECAVLKEFMIKDILYLLSENAYIILTVTTKDGKILFRLSETELIERLINHKCAKTLADII